MGWLDNSRHPLQAVLLCNFQSKLLPESVSGDVFTWRHAPDPYRQSGHAHATVPCHKLAVLYQ